VPLPERRPAQGRVAAAVRNSRFVIWTVCRSVCPTNRISLSDLTTIGFGCQNDVRGRHKANGVNLRTHRESVSFSELGDEMRAFRISLMSQREPTERHCPTHPYNTANKVLVVMLAIRHYSRQEINGTPSKRRVVPRGGRRAILPKPSF
jgi:hypothetical protein